MAQTQTPSRPALVIGASSLGTMFEWYDFFLYGALASQIARHFFAGVSDSTAFIFALATFSAGFFARPFGALVFGRLGDVIGRKTTFLATMAIMGVSTFLVGLLPGYATLGAAAPLLLVGLRVLQGLAIGGEYGGAAIYVAEHAPPHRRGLHTSWINAMATLGLVLSLAVIMVLRVSMPAETFDAWGWRLPFIASLLLLLVSLWIRMRLSESPVFQQMKAEATLSAAPLREAFGDWTNVKLILVALIGCVSGATVVWYTGQFYALFFLERMLKVDGLTTNMLVLAALIIGAPTYVLFGWLSDIVGRKPLLLAGALAALLTLSPAFHLLTQAANPALAEAQRRAPVVVHADPADCSFQFDPLGRNSFTTRSCDIAKSHLARSGVGYAAAAAPPGRAAQMHVGAAVVAAPDPAALSPAELDAALQSFRAAADAALRKAGYLASADPARINRPLVIAIVAYIVILGAMLYAPLAALLVEMFPARIRYTSLSAPYHIGSGWIGGFLPTTAFAIVAATGDIYAGLWYPLGFVALAFVVLLLFLRPPR